MSATLFHVTKWEAEEFEVLDASLFTRGVNLRKERRCPHCDSVVYSRRHPVCGVCCQPLPATCIFNESESATVKSLFEEERQRHRQWLSKENFEH